MREEEPSRRETRPEQRHAKTKLTRSSSNRAGCVVCGEPKHRKKSYFCKMFRTLKPAERNAAVGTLGASRRCLEVHDDKSCGSKGASKIHPGGSTG